MRDRRQRPAVARAGAARTAVAVAAAAGTAGTAGARTASAACQRDLGVLADRRDRRPQLVRGVGDGTLDEARFRSYVRQDYVFLIDYGRLLALGAARAPRLAEMRRFAALAQGVLETEMALHVGFAERWGIGLEELEAEPPEPATAGYTDFLLRTAALGEWHLRFGADRRATMTLDQGTGSTTARVLGGLVRSAHACGQRTLVKSASACADVTVMPIVGRVVAVGSIFIRSSNEIGAFESGLAAKFMGTVPSVIFGGIMTLVSVGVLNFLFPKLHQEEANY